MRPHLRVFSLLENARSESESARPKPGPEPGRKGGREGVEKATERSSVVVTPGGRRHWAARNK